MHLVTILSGLIVCGLMDNAHPTPMCIVHEATQAHGGVSQKNMDNAPGF